MTESTRDNTKRIEATRDASAALIDDLEHFRETQNKSEISFRDIRYMSVTLRRLVCENDLSNIASPRMGRLRIKMHDNARYERLVQSHKVLLFASLGAYIFDGHLGAICAFDVTGLKASRKLEKQRIINGHGTDDREEIFVNIESFCRQKVIYTNGFWITRHAVITFVANKLSGAHSDSKLNQIEKCLAQVRSSHRLSAKGAEDLHLSLFENGLDNNSIEMKYNKSGIDLLSAEILSAAHNICSSPDIIHLEDIIKSELEI